MSTILVIAEHESGQFKKTAYELLGKGSELASELGATLTAGVLGDAPAGELGAFGASKVYQIAADLQTTADGSKREREGRDEERKRY
jgi:electron transfer flavoprotein alpha subunit